MKKILGIDLGVASIGWAYTMEDDNKSSILGLGVRIVPLQPDEKDEFSRGNKISKNQKRTLRRTQRKGYDRYQLRKKYLSDQLLKSGMFPEKELFKLSAVELYGLRSKAINEQIGLNELGRILFHLNQKRGYKSSRKDIKEDAKLTEYETEINNRYQKLSEKKLTIGEHFYNCLKEDNWYRIKEKIFPRQAYMEEFDRIWDAQQKFYPKILTDDLRKKICSEIIFYQRPLKSQKGLVSICDFEGQTYITPEGKNIFSGPRVTPKSSPLFQVCKIWETINNITIKNRKGEDFIISSDQKQIIYEHLDNNIKLSQAELFKILEIGKNDGYYANALINKKGLQGNTTKAKLIDVLNDYPGFDHLLSFPFAIENLEPVVDADTGEIITRKIISPNYESQPLYKLWHIIYSIPDEESVVRKLVKQFQLPEEAAKQLAKIDFTNSSFGNKSSRAIRKILPYLLEGNNYYNASVLAGYNPSDSITTKDNNARLLQDALKNLPKNSLRQPVVEKVLNQLINLVNAILSNPKYGRPDEIRVELARELKQSRDERNDTFKRINEIERYHDKIRKILSEHPEYPRKTITKRDIERYKLWEEFGNRSPYEPNKIIGISKLFNGEYDIEHIIPKSRLFDDGYSNKTICPRKINSGQFAKNQMTAYDYMQGTNEDAFNNFLALVDTAYVRGFNGIKITKAKRDRLLMTIDKIPQDFIQRQLTETRYISRKAREILMPICRNVLTTSGSVTSYLRNQWGWNDVLVRLNWEKYPTEDKSKEVVDGRTRYKINNWSKRDDHRHHAIDALTIACTNESIIHRLNNLNKLKESNGTSNGTNTSHSAVESLKTYIDKIRPFTTEQVEKAAEGILISVKSGKKVATFSKRKVRKNGKSTVVQEKIITPRGPLSEESVYGKIIIKGKEEYVIRKKLGAGIGYLFTGKETQGVLDSIVDKGIRTAIKNRLIAFDNNPKLAFADLENNPVWLNEEKRISIKSIRCFARLNNTISVNEGGADGSSYIKYYKPGNNHHVALYKDSSGKIIEHTVTLWHAVERIKHGLPVIIENPANLWNLINDRKTDLPELFLEQLPEFNWEYIVSMQQNEMFIFDLNADQINELIKSGNYKAISDNIYRVQKMSVGDLSFRHHLATSLENKRDEKRIRSFKDFNVIKVKLNCLGEIIKVGEHQLMELRS
jgi:CRISPR-associated endonuclease Csn1